jgi:hypothetical protein
MGVVVGDGMRVIQRIELEDWFNRARQTWSPILVAGRQFNALLCEGEDVPGLAAYDDLYEVADLAIRWLEGNPCPDKSAGRHFTAQMMGYRAVADTVRSTITEEDGDAMVVQLRHLRDVIDQHAQAIDIIARPRAQPVPEKRKEKGGSIMKLRRRVPRQPAGWNGTCRVEGESADGSRPCRVIDISMLGLGMTFNHPSPSHLVGRRISVEVPAVGDSVSIQLEGRVANAGPTLGGSVRVGIEFDGLSEPELGIATAQSETSHRTGTGLKPTSGR